MRRFIVCDFYYEDCNVPYNAMLEATAEEYLHRKT